MGDTGASSGSKSTEVRGGSLRAAFPVTYSPEELFSFEVDRSHLFGGMGSELAKVGKRFSIDPVSVLASLGRRNSERGSLLVAPTSPRTDVIRSARGDKGDTSVGIPGSRYGPDLLGEERLSRYVGPYYVENQHHPCPTGSCPPPMKPMLK